MIKQEIYDKINSSLNDMLVKPGCPFDYAIIKYQEYLHSLGRLGISSLIYLDDEHEFYNLSLDIKRNKYVSLFDTISIARDIIKEISEISEIDYLSLYDDIIYKCVKFEVNDPYSDPEITWNHSGHYPEEHIDIHLDGTYDDVHTLVHEFFHLANSYNGGRNVNRTMYTEAVSIYFENYAINYMIKNNICSSEELDTTWRLRDHYRLCDALYNCGLELSYFNLVGNLSDESYKYIYEKFAEYPLEKYEEDIMKLYDLICRSEEKYEDEKYDLEGYPKEDYIIDENRSHYAVFNYILGVFIATYIKKYGSVLDACYLSERIRDNIEVDSLFERMGLNLETLKDECEYTYIEYENSKRNNPTYEKVLNAFNEYADEMINYTDWPKKRTITK